MKVSPIQIQNQSNYHKNPKFKGSYINNHYYDDEIVNLAKKALNNPNWEKELGSAFWRNYKPTKESILGRGAACLFSGGASELFLLGMSALLPDDTEEIISKIKACMKDLRDAYPWL